jgi:hypothetical protein
MFDSMIQVKFVLLFYSIFFDNQNVGLKKSLLDKLFFNLNLGYYQRSWRTISSKLLRGLAGGS